MRSGAQRFLVPGGASRRPALLAGIVAGTHRAALRELQRRIMSGESPARARNAVAPAALRSFNLLCRGLHADTGEQMPQ